MHNLLPDTAVAQDTEKAVYPTELRLESVPVEVNANCWDTLCDCAVNVRVRGDTEMTSLEGTQVMTTIVLSRGANGKATLKLKEDWYRAASAIGTHKQQQQQEM